MTHFMSAGGAPGARLDRRGERGQSLIFFAGALGLLCAVLGLVLDGSNLQLNRRRLQNAADAAAFAGAYDLTASPSLATTDSVQWLTKNGSSGTEVVTNAVSTTTVANDTITVSLLRNVPYSVMKVLGLTSGNVTATAKVQVNAATGMWTSSLDFFTYAVWEWKVDASKPINTVTRQIGDTVIFNSNKWITDNIQNPNSNPLWNTGGNDFKGFMSDAGMQSVNIADPLVQGGQQCGQQPVSALQAIYNNPNAQGQSIVILPVIDKADASTGQVEFHVAGFVAVNIRIPGSNIPQGCPQDFAGVIVGRAASNAIHGGIQPTSDLGCGSGVGLCTPILTQ